MCLCVCVCVRVRVRARACTCVISHTVCSNILLSCVLCDILSCMRVFLCWTI